MCGLFSCIPTFFFFFFWGGEVLLKNEGIRDILRKHLDTPFLMCFDGKKGDMQENSAGYCKTHYSDYYDVTT